VKFFSRGDARALEDARTRGQLATFHDLIVEAILKQTDIDPSGCLLLGYFTGHSRKPGVRFTREYTQKSFTDLAPEGEFAASKKKPDAARLRVRQSLAGASTRRSPSSRRSQLAPHPSRATAIRLLDRAREPTAFFPPALTAGPATAARARQTASPAGDSVKLRGPAFDPPAPAAAADAPNDSAARSHDVDPVRNQAKRLPPTA
jgi:hypothetical protein